MPLSQYTSEMTKARKEWWSCRDSNLYMAIGFLCQSLPLSYNSHWQPPLHPALMYMTCSCSALSPTNTIPRAGHIHKGRIEGCIVAGGSCGSVAGHWQRKPKALGLNPGSSTFLSYPTLSHFQRSADVMAQLVILRT